MYYLYILQSKTDNGFYTGIMGDVDKRLISHNSGSTRSTKRRRPFTLVHVEGFSSRAEARAREVYLKSYAGAREKMQILEKCRVV